MSDSHDHFQGRSPAVLSVTLLFATLSTIFVALRLISRAAIVKKVAIDDYFIVLAWLIAAGITSAICYGCAWGLGRHEASIPPDWQENLRKADYAFSIMYQPALMAFKTSILAFYLSLPTMNRQFRWACITTLFAVNAGGLALCLVTVFQCSPVGAAFQVPEPANSHCTDVITIYLSSVPLNMITDLALLFLPMPLLTELRLPRKQKIILIITFSFGAFVTIVDVIRIVYLQSAAQTRLREIFDGTHNTSSSTEHTDFSWYAALSYMWSAIEVNVGIMVACVPALKPLVSRFLPHMLRDRGDARGSFEAPGKAPSPLHLSAPEAENEAREDSGVSDGADGGPMGMLDFLTTPEMTELPMATQTMTRQANSSRDTRRPSVNFFDFVDMGNKKSLVELSVRECVFPIAMVTVLFFIWGFEYGLLDVLNQQFQRVAHMTPTQSTGIHSAYWVGYFFGPILVGRLVLKHWGFKACYPVGLAIYGCGTLIFWPAAVLTSFPAFIITNFIVAFGLSILEVSANPFIILCGPTEYSEIRLNFSQGVQAIGSVVAPLIAEKAFFRQSLHAPSLVDTQWAYLGISLFTISLAVAYYYIPLPEVSDVELANAAERLDGANHAKIRGYSVIWLTLAVGVFAQFCYVGAQEVNGTTFDAYLTLIAPTRNTANYMAIAHTAFAVSRFMAAGLGFWVKPRILILACFLACIVFEALAMKFSGDTGTAMIMLVFFFEGPLFSLIFAQALRGMGRYTKIASVCITAAASGGAVFSPISNHLTNTRGSGGGAMFALVVGAAVFAAGTVFPLWLNGSPQARKQCDPVMNSSSASAPRAAGPASEKASGLFAFLHVGGKRGGEGRRSVESKEESGNE